MPDTPTLGAQKPRKTLVRVISVRENPVSSLKKPDESGIYLAFMLEWTQQPRTERQDAGDPEPWISTTR
ncbi:hypothetical protein [Amphibiibacter pelophylacis]|uniref:Uncharacterized protein n=1 Tax=Amphibiibacter pelophylacis TaxID=1799477 RepID=A0ACC6P1A2_9BURK